MTNDKVVFRFREGPIDIAIMEKNSGFVTVKNIITINPASLEDTHQYEFNTEDNVKAVKDYVQSGKIKIKKVKVLLACDGIITRLVETPFLRKKELDAFIKNNIGDYFTVNIEDYCYDYKVVSREKEPNKKLVIFLVVFPKKRIEDITSFINECGLLVDEITVYPESINNLFYSKRDSSIAVFDISSGRSNITLIEKGKVFLYSAVTTERYFYREDNYEEILDNLSYFLNFYSTRHFGNKVDHVYLIGEYWNDIKFLNILKEQFGIETFSGIKSVGPKVFEKRNIDKNKYLDIVGTLTSRKNIYNKKIDFKGLYKRKKVELSGNGIIYTVGILSTVITITFILFNFLFINHYINKYNSSSMEEQVASLLPVESEVNRINSEKTEFQKKQTLSSYIEGDKVNFTAYIDALQKSLPSNISITSVSINKETIGLKLNINGALDRLKVVTSINDMAIFERIEIDSIKLDNSEREVNLNLKINKPL